MEKMLLIDAICGCGWKSYELAGKYQNKGLMYFTGNQYNPDWKWDKLELEILVEDELIEIYKELKGK